MIDREEFKKIIEREQSNVFQNGGEHDGSSGKLFQKLKSKLKGCTRRCKTLINSIF